MAEIVKEEGKAAKQVAAAKPKEKKTRNQKKPTMPKKRTREQSESEEEDDNSSDSEWSESEERKTTTTRRGVSEKNKRGATKKAKTTTDVVSEPNSSSTEAKTEISSTSTTAHVATSTAPLYLAETITPVTHTNGLSLTPLPETHPSHSVIATETRIDHKFQKLMTEHLIQCTKATKYLVTQLPQVVETKTDETFAKVPFPKSTNSFLTTISEYSQNLSQMHRKWHSLPNSGLEIPDIVRLYEEVEYVDDEIRSIIQNMCVDLLRFFLSIDSITMAALKDHAYMVDKARTLIIGGPQVPL